MQTANTNDRGAPVMRQERDAYREALLLAQRLQTQPSL
jgi:hypothetical protein